MAPSPPVFHEAIWQIDNLRNDPPSPPPPPPFLNAPRISDAGIALEQKRAIFFIIEMGQELVWFIYLNSGKMADLGKGFRGPPTPHPPRTHTLISNC